ncbi:hypothetical protein [Paraliomyxa miuraensis]|uniref:hypothetical protein n=1 Tax=Paraliomyxa miuraensis TaxID=376150 RepID=UPI002253E698|nr:hypothetical protein [Paraliomyxa miuraensis]MCX4247637.1 hypothetical protein [Paraliomyxa miuraensis]
MVVWAAAGACGSSEVEPSAGAPIESKPGVEAARADEDPSAIPEDWVWVTDARGRFEVVMPALPRSFGTGEPSTADHRTLQAERRGATFTIVSRPAMVATALEELERELASKWAVSERAPWREHGLGLTLTGRAGVVWLRALVQDERLHTLEVTGGASAVDAQRFFDSLDARAEPRRGPLHDARRGYRVEAPARMGRWRDVSGMPPLIGHRGVFDGHQFGVNVNELLLVPDPEAALDGSVTQMRREFGGQLMEIDPREFRGFPSRRLELRAGDGMYATIRLVLDGSRLYQAGVYAPSGREATWANAYVDSLAVGE